MSHLVAMQQAEALLKRSLPGSRTTVQEHCQRARRIADDIWRRWQVGPYSWQSKHLRWVLEVEYVDLAPSTRYKHWLTVRLLVSALNKLRDWEPLLQGPWLRPDGEVGPLSRRGRPRIWPTSA